MFCPNCGKKDSAAQKFCRSCGLSLEKISQSVVEQLPTKLDQSIEQRTEKLEKLGVVALSVFGAGVLGFIIYGVVVKLMISQGMFITGLAILGLLVMIGCGLASVILFARANELKESVGKRKLEAAKDESPATLSAADTGRLLAEPLTPAFSVTDRTTELLTVEKQKK